MTPKKAFLAILAVLILTLLGGGAIYYFANNYLYAKASTISELKANIDVLDSKLVDTRRAITDYSDLSYLSDILDEVIPSEKTQSNVVGQLIEFANQSGVVVDNINFAPTNNANQAQALTQTLPVDGVSNINKLPINIGITGEYSQILSFLNKLETNRRITQVDSISLSPDESGRIFSSNLSINVYVRVN